MDEIMEEIVAGTGNVYEDLGYKDANAMKVKAELVSRLHALMKERQYTQQFVAEQTGIPQPRLSRILHGQFREVSEFKLMECLSRLGNDVEIRITPCGNAPQGGIHLVFA